MVDSTTLNQSLRQNHPNFVILSRLTVFLSWIGLHRFYVGKTITGSIFIFLFFGYLTLDRLGDQNRPELEQLSMILHVASMAWQFMDIFKVSFGQFTDTKGNKIALHIDSIKASNVQYGPLLIWACFAGIFGGHNFYAKKYKIAMLQLITLGGLGIWYLKDMIDITRGTFVDAQGNPIAHFYRKDPHIDVA